jgi:hypothetical protein
MRSPALLAATLLVLAAAFFNRDLLTGQTTPFYRDLGTTQRPARALYATLGPASLNPHASFGQPYRGNPNLVLAYPAPRSPRFLGAHLLAHLGLALAGAFAFLRRLGRTAAAALFGAFAFGLSGYVLSSTAFLNATTTIAWAPWLLFFVALAREASGRRRHLLALLGVSASSVLLLLGGEPALGLLTILLAFAFSAAGPAGTRVRAMGTLTGGGLVAALAIAPWLLEVARASAFSSRRVRGFSWEEFAAVGFHPARFLETPFPLLFGDPSRFLSGGFWGFAVNQGHGPYLASLSFGVLPLVFALLFVVSARRNEGRFWIAAAVLSLLTALLPWLPGARSVYQWLVPLHAFRYPVKAMFVFTLAIAVLGALAVDRLLLEGALPRFRRRAARVLLGASALLAAAAVAGRWRPGLIDSILQRGWDPAWRTSRFVVLGAIIDRLPLQAALAAAGLLVATILLKRGTADARGQLLLLFATGAGLLSDARSLLPRVPSAWYASAPLLVASTAVLPGRVYERTGKDLDPVRRGVLGRVVSDDLAAVGLAQIRQGWALTGAPWGLRYAYDTDPDGSYTYLNRVATDIVDGRDWPRKMKWLRAAGVGSVIASDVPPDLPGLEKLFTEYAGIPATVYRVTAPLAGVRRVGRVLDSASVTEAVKRFEDASFDPAADVVVYGKGAAAVLSDVRDPSARARVVADSPDALTVETSGEKPGILHVDRSYTPRAKASVNGAPVTPLVADIHLIGVPVPAGTSRVQIDLAP